eukprot:gene11781-biopygen3599
MEIKTPCGAPCGTPCGAVLPCCRVGGAVWRRAAPSAVRAAPCDAVRRYVPCGQRRAAPCGATCRAGSAVRRHAALRAIWAAPCGAMSHVAAIQ